MWFEKEKHVVYRVNKHKTAFNGDNDKRYVQADGITKLVRGYLA